jgi:hypothetical protein
VSCDVYFSRCTSPLNDASYHMIKAWAPVLTISDRRGLRPFQCRPHGLKSCHEVCDSPGKDCIHMLLQVSPQERKFIAGRSGDRGDRAISHRRRIHLPEYIPFNHCPMSSVLLAGAASCWNHNPCLTLRDTSSSIPGHDISEQSGCR